VCCTHLSREDPLVGGLVEVRVAEPRADVLVRVVSVREHHLRDILAELQRIVIVEPWVECDQLLGLIVNIECMLTAPMKPAFPGALSEADGEGAVACACSACELVLAFMPGAEAVLWSCLGSFVEDCGGDGGTALPLDGSDEAAEPVITLPLYP
jgi:hypothetical protein